MPRVEYPQILRKSDWDINKGVVAKMHGETGLGAACETAERKYHLINWRIVEASNPNADAKFVDGLMRVEFRRHILPASEYMLELKGKCDEVAAQFKQSRTIAVSSRLHVEKMSQTAAAFSRQLRDTHEMKFETVLSSPVWLHKFQGHCRSEFNDNELDFLVACRNAQHYPEFPPTGRVVMPAERARAIFDEFIVDGARRQINLAGSIQNPLWDAGKGNRLAQADWQPAILACYRLLRADPFVRFMRKQRESDLTMRW
jgi:Regulator of G protein signaling domain